MTLSKRKEGYGYSTGNGGTTLSDIINNPVEKERDVYEEKENYVNGDERNILNEKPEACRQHKICFKQDMLEVYHNFQKNNTVFIN